MYFFNCLVWCYWLSTFCVSSMAANLRQSFSLNIGKGYNKTNNQSKPCSLQHPDKIYCIDQEKTLLSLFKTWNDENENI